MEIIWPSGTKQVISDIIQEIGRPVTFFTVWSSMACPDCSLDPVTNTSTDAYCLTCNGTYWIPIYSGYSFDAHVTWKYQDYNEYNTGGITFLGDCKVKVLISGISQSVIENAEYCMVDGKRTSIEKVTILGIPTPNRIIVDLKEENDG